jgi:hypothetical protein
MAMLSTRLSRGTCAALFASLVLACDAADRSSAPAERPVQKPPIDTAKANPPVMSKLVIRTDTSWAYVGRRIGLEVDATDVNGRPMNSDGAEITLTDTSVAQIGSREVYRSILSSGDTIRGAFAFLNLAAVGTTTIRARLGDFADSITVTVNPLPPPSSALVVDDFYVVEQHVCESECAYLVYWPIMRLREPTGTSYADAVAIEFTVPTKTTGMCMGPLRFATGASDYVDYVRDYLWSNDLLMVSLNGTPVPDGLATAHVIVRDAHGTVGTVEATGPILRGLANPSLPRTASNLETWYC